MAHHRDEMGPDEPDKALYAGYPIPRASFRRKLARDAFGSSGWKNLRPLLRAAVRPASRRVALPILAVQGLLFLGFLAAGRPQLYLVLWLLPWMTSWRVINRLRAIAEHGGMGRAEDKRQTTHHVRQHWPARFWMVPYHTGWHLAHHVDAGIPWRNLPRLHRELEAAGWITPGLEWSSYPALWRALSAG
jgi:fatty acid desaturase